MQQAADRRVGKKSMLCGMSVETSVGRERGMTRGVNFLVAFRGVELRDVAFIFKEMSPACESFSRSIGKYSTA